MEEINRNKSLESLTFYSNEFGLIIEEWKPIVGYEGLYEISSFGRIKSLEKSWKAGWRKDQSMVRGEYIKSIYKMRQGYWQVRLNNNGFCNYLVHVLVARHFIHNPENKKEVNHKLGDKDDNKAISLEWATPCENMQHAHRTGLKKGVSAEKNTFSKIVLDTLTGVFYDCAKQVAETEGYNYFSFTQKLCGRLFNDTKYIYA